jgi:hypothetical protein
MFEHAKHADTCACGPKVVPIERDDGNVVFQIVHNSFDGREHSDHDHDRKNCEVCSGG